MKKYLFPFLVALSAFALAGAAAFFSVTGLSKLFGGAKTEVIIMASALEFAKLVTASFLHRYWHILKWQMKTYLTIGVVTVMLITSAGIYGFLSSAYSATASKLDNVAAQVEMVDQKKVIINSEISRLQENKDLKSNRVQSLVSLRLQQEARVDSLYNRKQTSSAKRVELQIEQSSKEISITTIEVDTINSKIQRKYGEVSILDLEVLDLKNNDINGEVGPLKYIAKLTGKDMDSVVNFFILLLIFVFDPLAVSLVIATNIALKKETEKDEVLEIKKDNNLTEGFEPLVVEEVKKTESIEEGEARESSNSIQNYTQEISNVPLEESSVKYVVDKTGEFKPEINESDKKVIVDKVLNAGLNHNASYLNFLDVLFENGKFKIGDSLMGYQNLLKLISDTGLVYTEKEVTDFLTICNLIRITDMKSDNPSDYKLAKDYEEARGIITLLTK